jgi:hypothetical protein
MKTMTERKDESLIKCNSFGSLKVDVKKKILLDYSLQNSVQPEPLLGPTKSWKYLRGRRRV